MDNNKAQEVEINIDKMYNDFIKEIDEMRSITPIANVSTLNFDKIKVANFGSIKVSLSASNEPTESRCHAFFRLIGLPVVSESLEFYSPGFFKDLNADNDEIEKRLNLLRQIDKGFYKVSSFREAYYSQTIAPMFSKQDITSSVIALSSYNFRSFTAHMENNIELSGYDFIKPQSYTLNFYNDPSDQDPNASTLKKYALGKDSSGAPITPLEKDINKLALRYHIIQPFTVDPRIDMTVQPPERRVCVPFVENKSKTQIRDNVYLKRPIIEKVIRERFYQQQEQKDSFQASKPLEDSLEYFKSFKNIQDNEILTNIYSGNVYSLSDQGQFIKFIKIIKAALKRLYESKNIIKQVRDEYHWIPKPSKTGPEFGSTTYDINILNSDELNTTKDKEISTLFSKYVIDAAIAKLPQSQPDNDLGSFSFSSLDSTSNPEDKESAEKLSKKALDEASQKRRELCEKANDALKTIEIIMGEFSGLGLIDIFVLYYSLYLIDKGSLIGLVDDQTIKRMETMGFNELGDRDDLASSYESFANIVKNLYDIVESLWKDMKLKPLTNG